MTFFLKFVLRIIAKAIIRKYKPNIIGITGSIGKTSTKEAIFAVLDDGATRVNKKNYNNEIGVPITILGIESYGKNIFLWMAAVFRACGQLIIKKRYPRALILEMAADHPGDIAYLTNIAPPNIGIVTAVSPTHLEFFKTIENVSEEKKTLIRALPKEGLAIVNVDLTPHNFTSGISARAITYGIEKSADIMATEIQIRTHSEGGRLYIDGSHFKIRYQGSLVPIDLNTIWSYGHFYAILAACAAGVQNNLNLIDSIKRLEKFTPPAGRSRVLQGKNNSLIVDESYNSSPMAVELAIRSVQKLQNEWIKRRVLILGDMNELGEESEKWHRYIGRFVAESGMADYLICFGKISNWIADEAICAGISSGKVLYFSDFEKLNEYVAPMVSEGTIFLIKGSQNNVRLERLVKALMQSSEQADELLVRQEKEWTH
ncbi:MAG: hypothetical protein HYW78_04370 [Parcubacteria group bacterium]|nr:hypothetical protein [Parcubacteria group bacterium]